MRILFFGDVVGRDGRKVITDHVPKLRKDLNVDFVIVNGENAASGVGITDKICQQFYEVGVDVITLGNHAWDQKEILNYIGSDIRLLRPLNMSPKAPGRGAGYYKARGDKTVAVIQVMGQVFMPHCDNPFHKLEAILDQYTLGKNVNAIVVDIHAEATSEKASMGVFCDGRVSFVVGTHSHVPTADQRILPKGTAYMTDVGMCGNYDSIIGMEKEEPLRRFLTGISAGRFEPAKGEATLCGALVDTDDMTGLATQIIPIRLGPHLAS